MYEWNGRTGFGRMNMESKRRLERIISPTRVDEEGVAQGNKHDAGDMYLETKGGRIKFQKTCRS